MTILRAIVWTFALCGALLGLTKLADVLYSTVYGGLIDPVGNSIIALACALVPYCIARSFTELFKDEK